MSSSNPKQRHRVLVVGVGSIGERHLRCFKATGRAVLGIVETNAALCAIIAQRYEIPDAFASLDLAMANRWDGAVVATPANTHLPISVQLARAGTHLLIEKPLATSLDGIGELNQTIARHQVTACVGYTLRSHPLLQALHDTVKSGKFGEPVNAVIVGGQYFPAFRPAYREIYYARRASGGGAIQDALTHLLNAGEWMLGPIDKLCADAAHLALPGVDVEDTVHVIARHGPVLASYTLNQHQAPNETSVTIVCRQGTLRAELHTGLLRTMTEPSGTWQDQSLAIKDRDEIYTAQANRFMDGMETGKITLCSIEEAAQTLRVNLRVLQCADEGCLRNVRE